MRRLAVRALIEELLTLFRRDGGLLPGVSGGPPVWNERGGRRLETGRRVRKKKNGKKETVWRVDRCYA